MNVRNRSAAKTTPTRAGQELAAAIRRQSRDGGISCPELRLLAEQQGVSYAVAGAAADGEGIHIHHCELGLFGARTPTPDAPRSGSKGPARLPVISVVGRSNSGKTTLLERVVASLVGRGRRVGVAKHHAHQTEIDVPGKDTWRFTRAGAEVTMITGPDRLGIIRRVERKSTLEELVAQAGEVDLLLTEGFSGSSPVRIEVVRAARSHEPISDPHELSALVTDVENLRHGTVPAFDLDQIEAIADFIEALAFGSPGAGSAGTTDSTATGKAP